MVVELLPSVLASTKAELQIRSARAQKLSQTIHLDVMDGHFVTSKSVSIRLLAQTKWKRLIEIHAMVTDPISLLPLFEIPQLKRMYFHVELGKKLLPIIKILRAQNIELGLAIKPKTPLTALTPYLRYAKSILVLSVEPGSYQAPLWPGTFHRLHILHRRWPKIMLACDGHMNADTILVAIAAGARRIVIGSDVMFNRHPMSKWNNLVKLTK